MRKVSFSLVTSAVILTLSGCAPSSWVGFPETPGEARSHFNYVPLDPLPVLSARGNSCESDPKLKLKGLLKSLPDHAVRVAIGQFDANGNLTFGPVKAGANGTRYQVVLDYVVSDVTNMRFAFKRNSLQGAKSYSVFEQPEEPTRFTVSRVAPGVAAPTDVEEVAIPVYVGIGVRITASVTTIKGNIELANLGAIAVAAQAGQAYGDMTIQSLGVTGKPINLPVNSEINPTTIQNAMMSVGTIKAMVYDPDVVVTPRVTGFYNPISGAGPEFVNAIVSEMAKMPVTWHRPCENEQS